MRYRITIIVEPDPKAEFIGIKEDIVTHCERFGDIKKVTVEPIETEQMKIEL